jgi:diguanylate cyclase (GGDEF)-like protein
MGEIQGIVCFLRGPPGSQLESKLLNWLDILGKALSLLEAEKRLHVVSTKDLSTDVFNRQNFMIKVGEEISRSRRTKLPVALVQISIDQFGRLNSTFGLEESQTVMRTAAQIFQKHSRVNDIVGRMGTDEFGLLLPHTDKEGAMIKAERLRRMFETADFEKIMRGVGKLTISLGVSEYPTLARDTEELVQTADDALYQVRQGGNKTCVAQASEDFEPDFTLPAKGP